MRGASGRLARAALARMDQTLPWFAALPAAERSWVGLVAEAGIAAFVGFLESPTTGGRVSADVFRAAPRDLTRQINLRHTVELVRVTVQVVDDQVASLAAPGDEAQLREAVLRFSAEIAFAAAAAYAQAAESRGAWDARLEALVVDDLLRGGEADAVRGRAAALGWVDAGGVFALVGQPPATAADVLGDIARTGRSLHVTTLAAVRASHLVVVVGDADNPMQVAAALAPLFGDGPVVAGPLVDDLADAGRSAAEALSGLRAAPAHPQAPRPVAADDLLAERALAGDAAARRRLVDTVTGPLGLPLGAPGTLGETVAAYLDAGGSLEATARALYVHPNTVRYRLARAAERTGYAATDPRDGFVLRVALALGRLDQHTDDL